MLDLFSLPSVPSQETSRLLGKLAGTLERQGATAVGGGSLGQSAKEGRSRTGEGRPAGPGAFNLAPEPRRAGRSGNVSTVCIRVHFRSALGGDRAGV